MKGIIFNLLEEFVIETQGIEIYEEILAATPLRTTDPFVGPGSYPDADLMALVKTTVARLGLDQNDVLHAFGRFCIPKLAQRFPALMAPYQHPKAFLLTVTKLHELEVRKLYPDATPPRFAYESPAENRLVMRYLSPRQLCALVAGLIDGVADHYGVPIGQEQTRCMASGADCCEFQLTFATPKAAT
jgi:hypothetical protein